MSAGAWVFIRAIVFAVCWAVWEGWNAQRDEDAMYQGTVEGDDDL